MPLSPLTAMFRLLTAVVVLLVWACPAASAAQKGAKLDLSAWDARRGNLDAAFDRGAELTSPAAQELLAEVQAAEGVPAWYLLEIRALAEGYDRVQGMEAEQRSHLAALLAARPDHRSEPDAALDELLALTGSLGELLGPSHPSTVQRWWTLSKACTELGRWDDALSYARRALERAEAGRLEGEPRPLQTAFRRMWLGWILHRMARHEEAETQLLEAHRAFEDRQARQQGAFVEISLFVVSYLGVHYQSTGRLDQAEAMLRTYVEATGSAFGESSMPHLTGLNNLSSLMAQLGKTEQSIVLQSECLARALRVMDPASPDLTQLWLNLGSACMGAGRMQDAREAFSRIALEPGPLPIQAALGSLARMRLAYLEAVSMRFELARQHAQTAMDRHRSQPLLAEADARKLQEILLSVKLALGDHEGIAAQLPEAEKIAPPEWGQRLAVLRGAVLQGSGDTEGALAFYAQAQDRGSAESGWQEGWASAAAVREAGLRFQAGDLDLAQAALTRSLRLHEAMRARLDPGFERSEFTRSPTRALAHVELARGKSRAAWQALERTHGRALTELLTTAPTTQQRELERSLADTERRLAALDESASRTDAPSSDRDMRQRELEAQRLELRSQILGLTESSTPALPTLPEVQSSLRAGTALVGWSQLDWLGRAEVFGWVLRAEGEPHFVPIEDLANGSPLQSLRALSASLEEEAGSPFPSASWGTQHDSLGEHLLTPLVESGALDGADHLVIVPSRFDGIPFGALRWEDSWASERWVISYAPSCRAYRELRARPKSAAGRALVIGDPPFRPEHLAGASAVSSSPASLALLRGHSNLGELARIPETLIEAQAVASLFPGSTLWTGPEANEAALQELARSGKLASYSVIHLASHAVVDSHDPRRSGIALSQLNLPDPYAAALGDEPIVDGFLSVPEVLADWDLRADLVTLSACSSALGSPVHGEGYVGLATAFLQAGARSLLVSLWDVQDEPARLLMESFYRHWRENEGPLSKARALQAAQAELRSYEKNGQRPYAHPAFWSAFVLIGSPD